MITTPITATIQIHTMADCQSVETLSTVVVTSFTTFSVVFVIGSTIFGATSAALSTTLSIPVLVGTASGGFSPVEAAELTEVTAEGDGSLGVLEIRYSASFCFVASSVFSHTNTSFR